MEQPYFFQKFSLGFLQGLRSINIKYAITAFKIKITIVLKKICFVFQAEDKSLVTFLTKASDVMEKMRRIEGRVASDQDLKLSDTLRYHMRDTNAAKDLLFRRLKCLNAYENANKTLEKARAKNKDVIQAENGQQEACKNFENISDLAKDELKILRQRRVAAFQKSLTELAELELKHSKAHAQMLRTTIANLKADL